MTLQLFAVLMFTLGAPAIIVLVVMGAAVHLCIMDSRSQRFARACNKAGEQ